MMTINKVSKLAGVSIRTLQYYDKIGLLKPAKYTESGYRLYDDTALEILQQILLWKELEFSFSVPEHETFWYGVILSFGNKAKIIEPQKIKERIIKTCKEIQMEYRE